MWAMVTPIIAVDSSALGLTERLEVAGGDRVALLGQMAQAQPIGGDERHLGRREEHRGQQAHDGQPELGVTPPPPCDRLAQRDEHLDHSRALDLLDGTTSSGVSRRSALRGTRPNRSRTQPPTVS